MSSMQKNKILKNVVFLILVLYLIINLLIHIYIDKLIFPYKGSSYNQQLSGLSFFESADNLKVAKRYWKIANDKGLVLYFHGNFVDVGHLDPVAELINDVGFSFLAMDYRGYGMSQGEANTDDINSDAQLLYRHAIGSGYEPQNIIIIGRSVGTGVATNLASKNPSRALILVSPYTSALRVLTGIKLLFVDRYDNLALINEVKASLFLVHGVKDQLIKPWHTNTLYEAFKGKKKKLMIENASHDDIWSDYHEHFVRQIFESLMDE